MSGVVALEDAKLDLLFEAMKHAPQRLRVHGRSMLPSIRPGSVVELSLGGDYDLGDIVAVRTGGVLRVHRVVGVRASGELLVKGDACRAPDGWFWPSALCGHARLVEAPR